MRHLAAGNVANYSKVKTGWRAQVAVLGVRESRTLSTKAEAVAWAAARETEIRSSKETGILAGKTVGGAFDRYEKEVSSQKRGHRFETLRLRAIGD